MEQQIRHVRFFNGQFLKEEEFREEQSYNIHMRRRTNYALLEDGVVQITPSDLTIEREPPGTNTRIRVRRGMAVGSNHDAFEGREIILREDSPFQDLAPLGFSPVWVTVNYLETETEPVDAQNSRVEENVEILFHATDPTGAVNAANDPLIVLGTVDVGTMNIDMNHPPRQIAMLRSALIATTPAISVSPNQVTAGGTVSLTVSSSGGLDLSTLSDTDITISPLADVSGITVTGATANSATVSFDITGIAAPGSRTLTITVNSVSASATFDVLPAPIGLALTDWGGVDEPNGDLQLKIVGTGFVAPVTVEFSDSGGGFTSPVTLLGADVTPTELHIALSAFGASGLLSTAGIGSIRVVSGGVTLVSGFDVVPPPVITGSPGAASSQSLITITGQRFFPGTIVTLPGGLVRGPSQGFPDTAFSETLSETQIEVRLISNAGLSARVSVTTGTGVHQNTVQSSTILTVT